MMDADIESARMRQRQPPAVAPVHDVNMDGVAVLPGPHASNAHRVGKLLIVVALAATVGVPLLMGGRAALSETLHFSLPGFAALFALMAASWLARAMKLSLLLRPMGVRASFVHTVGISLATDFAFIVTPAGVGGYAASVYYLRSTGASTSGAAAVTAADQGLDVMFFVLTLPLAAAWLLWSAIPDALGATALTTSAAIVVLILCGLLARRPLLIWLFGENFFSRRWPGLRRKQQALSEFIAKLRTHMDALLASGPLFLSSVFALTAIQQLARYGVLWMALLLLGHHVPFMLLLLIQTFVLQAASWTGVPAGGGAAELGLTATLAAWVPATSLATALLLWRMATLYLSLLAGAIAIAWLARRRRMVG